MTPSDIEILIHCHTCPTPHPRISASAIAETIRMFVLNGIVEEKQLKYSSGVYYPTTDRGKVLVEIICSTPLPIQKWVDHNGNIIEV